MICHIFPATRYLCLTSVKKHCLPEASTSEPSFHGRGAADEGDTRLDVAAGPKTRLPSKEGSATAHLQRTGGK
ncbi:unnamed protein product [Nesidiocoris tenuis]|uniref:Uncharacterized protein n=1 Tax=Nesidiocoris tenuis TaxID=355587 RepID=A0A6H5GNI3_9HEMI|nr:unnamed protein product [Nesidiocoris tenuis]